MDQRRLHVEDPSADVTRGWVRVHVALKDLPAVVRRAIKLSGRFSIVELDEQGGVLSFRTGFTSRALVTNLTFESEGEKESRVLVRSVNANRFGFVTGVEGRSEGVRKLLESIASVAEA